MIEQLLQYGYITVFLYVLASQLGVPVPSAPMMLAVGALASTGRIAGGPAVVAAPGRWRGGVDSRRLPGLRGWAAHTRRGVTEGLGAEGSALLTGALPGLTYLDAEPSAGGR